MQRKENLRKYILRCFFTKCFNMTTQNVHTACKKPKKTYFLLQNYLLVCTSCRKYLLHKAADQGQALFKFAPNFLKMTLKKFEQNEVTDVHVLITDTLDTEKIHCTLVQMNHLIKMITYYYLPQNTISHQQLLKSKLLITMLKYEEQFMNQIFEIKI